MLLLPPPAAAATVIPPPSGSLSILPIWPIWPSPLPPPAADLPCASSAMVPANWACPRHAAGGQRGSAACANEKADVVPLQLRQGRSGGTSAAARPAPQPRPLGRHRLRPRPRRRFRGDLDVANAANAETTHSHHAATEPKAENSWTRSRRLSPWAVRWALRPAPLDELLQGFGRPFVSAPLYLTALSLSCPRRASCRCRPARRSGAPRPLKGSSRCQHIHRTAPGA